MVWSPLHNTAFGAILWKRTEEKKMTPEVAKILVDGLCRIVFIGGVALCIYAFIKGFFDR